MTAVACIPASYTLAGRIARHSGLAKRLAYWRARGVVYVDPTEELLALQAQQRQDDSAHRGPSWPDGRCFACLCTTHYLHSVGETCARCSMTAYNWLPWLVQRGKDRLILVDEHSHERTAHFFDGREPVKVGTGPAWGRYGS